MAAGALKYIPRIFDALTSLPQEKLTARQARKHLKANVSKQELESTLPDLSSFPDDAPVTRSSLEQTAKENPFGIKVIPKKGTSDTEIDHEFRDAPDFLEAELDLDNDRIKIGSSELKSMTRGLGEEIQKTGTVSEYVPIGTRDERELFVNNVADIRFGIDGNMNSKDYDARVAFLGTKQVEQFLEDPKLVDPDYIKSNFLNTYSLEDLRGLGINAYKPYFTNRSIVAEADGIQQTFSSINRDEAENFVRGSLGIDMNAGRTEYGPETGMGLTSPGAYSNYTETLAQLTNPVAKKTSAESKIANALLDKPMKQVQDDFKGGHWGSEFPNIMWHTRQSTRPMHSIQDPVTKQSIPQNNAPGSLGEEFQDDWEAKVREFGSSPNPYRDVDLVQYSNERENLLRDTRKEYVPGQGGDNPNTAKNAYDFYDKKTMKPRREGEAHPGPRATPPRGAEGFTGYGETAEEAKASTLGFLNRLGTRVNRAAPEHPYASKTSEKAFRQAMAEAVDNNSPGLMWTTGKEQLRRTPHSDFPDKRKGLRSAYDDRIKKIANTIGKKFNTRVTTARTNTNANTLPGQERSYNAFFDDPADFATELKNYPVPSDLKITEELFGPVLRNKGEFVGEELNRNFYDFANAPVPSSRKQSPLMLPNVVKTRRDMLKESAENTQKQHYLPFTPELIAAIKKGIPLSVLTAFGLNNERESN